MFKIPRSKDSPKEVLSTSCGKGASDKGPNGFIMSGLIHLPGMVCNLFFEFQRLLDVWLLLVGIFASAIKDGRNTLIGHCWLGIKKGLQNGDLHSAYLKK